jgi:hypothetical protein
MTSHIIEHTGLLWKTVKLFERIRAFEQLWTRNPHDVVSITTRSHETLWEFRYS